MSDMQIRVITELAQFQTLADIWDSLQEKCSEDNSIYLTHEWLSTWWKHFGQREKIYILLIEKDHYIIGIVPLIRNEYRLGFIKLYALESLGKTSCNYVALIIPEYREEVISVLLTFLEGNTVANGAILRLSLIPEDSRFLGTLKKNMADFSKHFVFLERVKTLAPYIDLPATWEEYFRWLGWNRRSVLKRASGALTKEKGIVEFLNYDAGSLEEGLNRFFDLHQERWQSVGVSGTFADSRNKEFYREVASKLQNRNWLNFSCLTVNNEVVSAAFGSDFREKHYAITFGRNIRYAKYSVGHIHDMYLIKESISKRLREFDFLQGDEPYKFYWTKSVRRYMQVIIMRRNSFPALRMKLTQIFLRTCEIKQYSFKELYSLYRMKRREKREHQRMGIHERLEKLKSI